MFIIVKCSTLYTKVMMIYYNSDDQLRYPSSDQVFNNSTIFYVAF